MICIIPLRSLCKRLPDKNIKLIDGKPCFSYVLETAHRSGLFDKIIIAVDQEYDDIAKNNIQLGTIFYVRDSKNSRDESPLIDLVREVVDYFDIEDKSCCILYSTSVLTTEDQLKRSYKILREGKYKCVFPVVRQGNELFVNDHGANKNDCDYCLDDIAKHADSFFMFDIKTALRENKIIQDENGYIELKDYEAQDVHTEDDFKDLEYKLRARKCLVR